jgi:hypothetical protein
MLRNQEKLLTKQFRRYSLVLAVVLATSCLFAQTQQKPISLTSPPKGKSFAKPEDACAALYAAVHRDDEEQLLVILGPDSKEIVKWNDDPNVRREHREQFAEKYRQMHRLVKEPDGTVALYVGAENWPLPIPLVEYKGKWYFDADLGMQEIRYRRIGRNEMDALEVCHSLVDAEKEYRAAEHAYTAKFVSESGSHDGLYWKSADESKKSPIGPYLADAGIRANGGEKLQPYHGYYYRILLQNAGGEANSDHHSNGEGFAIVAFPAEYRSSGVMTFVMDQDGVAYEKDLGDQSATLARDVTSSHPDTTWKKVE